MKTQKKILVVDDEKGIRCLLSDVLSRLGFEVSLAKDGQESLDHLKERFFDLVITDINMPVLDGITMLKRMKKAGRKEKVIIMTASPVNEQGLPDGDMPSILTTLYKPFRMDSFLDLVIAATRVGESVPIMETGVPAIA